MTHSDDDGLVLPPRIAPAHLVIIPVTPKEATRQQVLDYCQELKRELEAQPFLEGRVKVEFDDRDMRGGEKAWGWIKKGIPVRVEVGPRDMQSDSVLLGVATVHRRTSRAMGAPNSLAGLRSYWRRFRIISWRRPRPTARSTLGKLRPRPNSSNSSLRRTPTIPKFTVVLPLWAFAVIPNWKIALPSNTRSRCVAFQMPRRTRKCPVCLPASRASG